MNQISWTPLGPPLPPPPPSGPPPLPVAFSGDRSEFFHLVKRGAGLELITLGFYRFWLATDMRRHLWSNTHVDGDAAEYTGRARELLIGFLVARQGGNQRLADHREGRAIRRMGVHDRVNVGPTSVNP